MIVSFEEYNKKEKEFNDYKDNILKLIDDFIDTDIEFIKNHQLKEIYKNIHDFWIDGRGNFIVEYKNWGVSDLIEFKKDEYNRLLEFMKEPELYKSTKKYNL